MIARHCGTHLPSSIRRRFRPLRPNARLGVGSETLHCTTITLFSRSQHFDGQDYTGLPWRFYYANVGSNPRPRRSGRAAR